MSSKKILFILDSLEYKHNENTLKNNIDKYCCPSFVYTTYENKLIQFFHKLPIFGSLFTHISYWFLSLVAALKILGGNKDIKYKVFINPIVAIFYSFFSNLINREESIIISGFLFEPKSNIIYHKLRMLFVNTSYKNISKIIVYSSNEIQRYKEIFPELSNKFFFVKYGRDFYYENKTRFNNESEYISSGGRSNRDYKCLIKAMELLESDKSKIKCILATRPEAVKNIKIPSNTILNYNIRLNKFGSFIENSLIFVLPLINTNLSAGHMSLFEAMSLGKLILVADIPSIRDYVNEDEVVFYKPEDFEDLYKKILLCEKNTNCELKQISTNAKNKYNAEYTFSQLLLRLTKVAINN